jgi:hypothetical protein
MGADVDAEVLATFRTGTEDLAARALDAMRRLK